MLPKPLLLCYALGAAVQSIPMVAFGVFLNDEIKMPLDEQSRFYATIFLPWSMKPLFSYIMDSCKLFGTRRKGYIFVANICLAVIHVSTALFVTNVPEMYISSFLRSAFEAFAECGLGLMMLDVVGQERSTKSDSAQVGQSESSAARMVGSLISFALGLFIYGCGSYTTPSSRTVIGSTCIFSIISGVAALFLTEKPVIKEAAPGAVLPESSATVLEDTAVSPSSEFIWNWRNRLHVGLGIMIFQFVFVWIGVQTFLPLALWATVLVACVSLIVAFSVRQLVKYQLPWEPVSCALLLFLLNATPAYESPWFSFQLSSLKGSSCNMQILLVIGEIASLLSCWMFPKITTWLLATNTESNRKSRAERALILFTIISSISGLMDILLALEWNDFIAMDAARVMIPFGVVAFVGPFFGQLSLVARQVYATENSYDNGAISTHLTPGVTYGIFLSLYDFGDSASGWITAPLTAALGLDYSSKSYARLWALVTISVVTQIVFVLLMPTLLRCAGAVLMKRYAKYAAVRDQDEQQLLPEAQRQTSNEMTVT